MGLPFYWTGKPCRRGGIAARATLSGRCLCCACAEAHRLGSRIWRACNPEKVREANRRHREAQRDKAGPGAT